ncbi:MAG TPA: hypothetical protein PKY59_08830 [Pyrinomonadaceae bacterium]|nr:hypothetical protein [Pyrinomonadaceae bacterium]
MDAENAVKKTPKIVIWYGRTIILLGLLLIPTGIVKTISEYLGSESGFFESLHNLYEAISGAIGICGFGLAVSTGKRWYLFVLLIMIFFGSVVIGFFSMAGKETNIGYYIWAIGGAISLSILTILYVYWEELLDG